MHVDGEKEERWPLFRPALGPGIIPSGQPARYWKRGLESWLSHLANQRLSCPGALRSVSAPNSVPVSCLTCLSLGQHPLRVICAGVWLRLSRDWGGPRAGSSLARPESSAQTRGLAHAQDSRAATFSPSLHPAAPGLFLENVFYFCSHFLTWRQEVGAGMVSDRKRQA